MSALKVLSSDLIRTSRLAGTRDEAECATSGRFGTAAGRDVEAPLMCPLSTRPFALKRAS